MHEQTENIIAAICCSILGAIGVFVNGSCIMLIINMKSLRTSFGYITLFHTFGNAVLISCYLFWIAPSIIFNRPTLGYITLCSILCMAYACIYFEATCYFTFVRKSLTFEFAKTPCGRFLSEYIDFGSSMLLFSLVIGLDICTLVKWRLVIKRTVHISFGSVRRCKKELRLFAQLGAVGIFVNGSCVLLIFKIKSLRTSFGYLTMYHSFSNGLLISSYLLWVAPSILLDISNMFILNRSVGQMTIIAQASSYYSMLLLSSNRFVCVYLPTRYMHIFSNKATLAYILLFATISLAYGSIYLEESCYFIFDVDALEFVFGETPCNEFKERPPWLWAGATFQEGDASICTAYKHSDKPIELECADVGAPGNLSKLVKFWQKDSMDIPNSTKIEFVENNASILFTSLAEEDSGIYSCCVKSSESMPFECFDRFLNVVSEDRIAAMLLGNGNNVTEEARNATAWSVTIANDRVLYAHEGDTYFVKIFQENTTDIKCEHDGGTDHVEKVAPSHAEYGDILFHPFNATLHLGEYICNSSYTHDNLTDIVQVTFTVTESTLPNTFEKVLEPSVVATLVTQYSFSLTFHSAIFITVLSFLQ